MKLLIHPDVAEQLTGYEHSLPHALLLTGKPGVGLNTLALDLAKDAELIAHIKPEPLTKTSTVPQIGVERIRQLYTNSRGKRSRSAVIIIDDADTMTESAQNSFLKLLEEPPEGVHFILTTHSPEGLLSTVKSRAQVLHVRSVTAAQTEELLDSLPHLDSIKRRQIMFIAEGLPAEILRLTNDDSYFRTRSERIRIAKQLAESGTAERFLVLLKASLTRDEAIATVKQLISLLELSPQPTSASRIQKLLKTLERLEAGGNIRLQLAAGLV